MWMLSSIISLQIYSEKLNIELTWIWLVVVRSGQMSEEELSRDWGRRYLETGEEC